MRFVVVAWLLALSVSVSAATSPSVDAEIAALLTRMELSGCEFYRNGSWYDAPKAKEHLELKLKAAGSLENTEQFIERVATKSSMSGRPYLVRCAGGQPIPSGDWLLAQLQTMRNPPTPPQTPAVRSND